jgi:hypothetical protein
MYKEMVIEKFSSHLKKLTTFENLLNPTQTWVAPFTHFQWAWPNEVANGLESQSKSLDRTRLLG